MRLIFFLIILITTPFSLQAKEQSNYFLLRGLIREQRHWGEFPKILEKAIKDSKVITLEIPGVGIYHNIKTHTSISKIVEFMRNDYLKEVKKFPSSKNYLVAMSLGGMIATEWMQKYPKDFDKAVLVNTSYKGFCSLFERLIPANYTTMLKAAFAKDTEKQEHYILEMVSNNPQHYDEVSKKWADIQNDAPVSLINLVRQLYAATTFTPSSEKPSTPLTLLSSLNDRFVSPNCSKNIHIKWNVPIQYHPSAGHEMALDAPEWMAQQIANWTK